MDPIVFEIARTLFAGISAAAAAVQVWYKFRDKKAAAQAFDHSYKEALTSPDAAKAAEELVKIIPEEVVKDLEARADQCWSGYRKVLDGDFLPDEIDKATESVQACVCRELGRLKKLNGAIPPRWQGQWDRYKCDTRGQGKAPSIIVSPTPMTILPEQLTEL